MKNYILKHVWLTLLLLSAGSASAQNVDWNVPYLVGARSGVQYDILYTRSRPSGTAWTTLDFDDSRWKAGKGPVGDINGPEGTAPIGLRCEANGSTYNL